MKMSKEYKIFRKIASTEGVSVEQVRKDIETGLSNPDPDVQRIWSSIPCKNNRPTPEELVRHWSRKIYKNRNDNLYI